MEVNSNRLHDAVDGWLSGLQNGGLMRLTGGGMSACCIRGQRMAIAYAANDNIESVEK